MSPGAGTLPASIEEALAQLGDVEWRERKEAVQRLAGELGKVAGEADVMDIAIGRLLDAITTQEAVQGRAAAQEVLAELGRPCVPAVLDRLEGRAPGARLLVELLGRIGSEEEVGAVAEIVRDAELDANLRASAAAALGELGGPQAQAALVHLLDDESEMLKSYALDALRTAGARVPVGVLEPLVQHPVVRKGVAALLGLTASQDAVPLLVPLLGDRMAGVRSAAVLALRGLEEELEGQGRGKVVHEALSTLSDAGRTHVRGLISHRDSAVREAAIHVAGWARDGDALQAVLEVMDDAGLQEHALGMVAELGAAANSALVELSDQTDPTVRTRLFRLMGAMEVQVADARLVERLLEGLEDSDEETAATAAEALKVVGGRSAMGALFRVMAKDGLLGEIAAESLGSIAARVGGPRSDELTLIVGGTWPHEGVLARNLCRVAALVGNTEYVPQLVALLGSTDVGVRIAAAQALGHLPGEHEGAGALAFALTDESAQVRAAASRSLGQLGSAQSCQPLLSATADPSPQVRSAAVQALVTLDNPIALARLREIIVDDPVPSVVVHAIEGLGASALEHDLTMLMSLCTSQDHEVVKAAARALESFPQHRATAALLGLLGHERWDVRAAAAQVLAKRGDPTAQAPLRMVLESEEDELVRDLVADAMERLSRAGKPQ